MVGETWDNWRDSVQKTIELAPDSVTVYQMELPYNTVFSKELHVAGQHTVDPRRSPIGRPSGPGSIIAFEQFVKAGYTVSSAYTVVRDPAATKFVYRDSLWRGADMFGTGVASFGHVSNVHMQNVDSWENYVEMLGRGELPLAGACPWRRTKAWSAR